MAPTPQVFMSYSHDDEAHKAWVLTLASRLMGDGVFVHLDQWDMQLGDNLQKFMESGLSESQRVIVISSEKYVEKANGRHGGAGFETNILSADMMSEDVPRNRVIPIIRNNESAGSRVPMFLKGVLFVDMRNNSDFEAKYEELLRTIHGVPKSTRPPLGHNPFDAEDRELYVPPSMSPNRYVSPSPSGTVSFPYENNSGDYELGNGDYTFKTHWSAYAPGAIYALRGQCFSVALAPGVSAFEDLGDPFSYDASSKHRVASEGDAVIYRNKSDYFATLLIRKVTTRRSGSTEDATLEFDYRIQTARPGNGEEWS
ncbi:MULTISPECIES: toll/interleukin-1 receptor domain-containing protein [Kocuria]|uniref:toll/interleukin-1 receptor domain-containing protein n=1 Tax=Kocuria TaxID=57493 RepID=UPI00117DE1D2|nr:toll/interleukin-1 receptor domain-containing protein [Kocuria flava]MBN6812947.1 toll/interleukin-1 receptor domain-containing protein [Kocuria indica]MBN6844672.1 toll/interleukin-1 receptor domain-containing protein [Kocuria indica]